MQFSFGSGSLWGINTAANSTPQEFGALQDVTLDFSFNLKELRGQYQFPLAVARGGGKITGKAKFANIDVLLYNSLFFGETSTVTATYTALKEAKSVPSATAYTVTVSNASTGIINLGVTYATTGMRLTQVASAPAATQYSVNTTTGVYTFSSADASMAVLIDYTYTAPAGGINIPITNHLMGAAPNFSIRLSEIYRGQSLMVTLNSCVSNKLAMATKLEDFTIPELDFEAMADFSNSIGTISIQ
jgi:hypothetical protein